jgi:uncharacterized protein (TIGR03435 family)
VDGRCADGHVDRGAAGETAVRGGVHQADRITNTLNGADTAGLSSRSSSAPPARWSSTQRGPIKGDPNLPALSTALDEQLGLKLESRRGPLDVLVIDSVQEPREN